MTAELWSVIVVSLKVAFVATMVVLILSIALAQWFVTTRFRAVRVLETLVYLPMAIPPVALGYGLLMTLGPRSTIGSWLHDYLGIEIAFSFLGAVIAAVFVSLGIGVRTARLAFQKIDQQQLHVAETMGASRAQRFFYIVLPQSFVSIVGGGVLVFIRALSEFGATIILAGNTPGSTRTLALAIWVGMETPGKEEVCAILVAIACVMSAVALMLAEFLSRNQRN